MEMLSVKVPADIARIVRAKDLSKAVRELIALELYREGLISLGKAAEIAGLSLWEMMELMARKGVPIRYGPEDLEEDLRSLEEASG